MGAEAMPERSTTARVSIVSAVDGQHLVDAQLWFSALNNQTLAADDYEVLLVDADHPPDYPAALTRFRAETEVRANISYHRTKPGGRPRALNRALELANGNLIIFLGNDFVAPSGFAEAHLRFHEAHPEVEAVGIGSAIIPGTLQTPISGWLEKSGRLFGVPFDVEMTEVPEHFFYAGNASVKRKLLEVVGRFDERFTQHAWDDFEFGQRLRAAGMKAHFVPDARADHAHRIDLRERERVLRHAGAAVKIHMIDYPQLYPWFMTARLPSWYHRLRVAAASVRLAIARTDKARVNWWQSRLDAALAAGYRNGS